MSFSPLGFMCVAFHSLSRACHNAWYINAQSKLMTRFMNVYLFLEAQTELFIFRHLKARLGKFQSSGMSKMLKCHNCKNPEGFF